MSSTPSSSLLQQLLDNAYHPMVASFLGSVLAVFNAFPGATIAARAFNGATCFIIGIYAGPAVVEWRDITSPRIGALVVLLSALIGLIVVNQVLELAAKTKLGNLPMFKGWLRSVEAAAAAATTGEKEKQ